MALIAAACSRNSGEKEYGAAEDAPEAVPQVTVIKVARADISRTMTLPGTVAAAPNQDVKVSSLVAGRVVSLKAAEGDAVAAGQLLAEIDDRPLRDQLSQAEAAATQARANLENAKLSLARNEDLLNRGIAARKEVEDARTQEQVAEAAVQQADAAVSLVLLQLTRTQVQSPLTGIAVKRFVNVGEQVDGTAAQPLLEVANLREVELNGNAPAPDLGKLRAGETLSFVTGAFPGGKFSGSVVAVSPAVDPATNTGLVRIRIANHDGRLRLGMFLSAEIPIETHAKALVVPPQAVYRDQQGQPRVYLIAGDQATSVAVRLGLETAEQVELLSGVKEGDTVILNGGYGLADQAKVSVKSHQGPEQQ
jgi:RND family efflux transporter MFP subunit